MQEKCSATILPRIRISLAPVPESQTHDPVLNLEREALYARRVEVPSFRVWRSSDSVVLGRFLEPEREVNLNLAAEHGIPVLRRTSGGGAVFHDLGNINYSIYLPEGNVPSLRIEERLRLLSFPITELLDALEVDWSWKPPNNVYVGNAKISGSAQARLRGGFLHHGTLLINTDLDRMRWLLKPGGRSCIAPVANLSEIVNGIDVPEVESMFIEVLSARHEPAI